MEIRQLSRENLSIQTGQTTFLSLTDKIFSSKSFNGKSGTGIVSKNTYEAQSLLKSCAKQQEQVFLSLQYGDYGGSCWCGQQQGWWSREGE